VFAGYEGEQPVASSIFGTSRLYSWIGEYSLSSSACPTPRCLAGFARSMSDDFEMRKLGISLTGRISALTPHTTVVAPIFTRLDPLLCESEPVFSWIGRGEAGSRFDGRRGGVCLRCACRRAEGERSGIAAGGSVDEGIAAALEEALFRSWCVDSSGKGVVEWEIDREISRPEIGV
jgi:hypothetical protein